MKATVILSLAFLFAFANLNFTNGYENEKDNESKNDFEHSHSEETTAGSFDIMMQVLTHQRCVNCHPAGDRPHQGDESRVHTFNIQRGADGHGMPNAQCSTCHQSENNDYSGVPGAPHWHLAPKSMAWEGLNRIQIAKSMLDKSSNGGRSIEEIEKHLLEDGLVLWAFDPGVDNEGVPREAPPVSKEEFFKAVKDWVAAGAVIPNE